MPNAPVSGWCSGLGFCGPSVWEMKQEEVPPRRVDGESQVPMPKSRRRECASVCTWALPKPRWAGAGANREHGGRTQMKKRTSVVRRRATNPGRNKGIKYTKKEFKSP